MGADFFNAKRFKTITFSSSKVEKISDKKYKVTGNLKIKGKSKKVTVNMLRGKTGLDPWGGYRTGGNIIFEINRKDFSVGKKDFDAPLIGNNVKIDFYWEALKK